MINIKYNTNRRHSFELFKWARLVWEQEYGPMERTVQIQLEKDAKETEWIRTNKDNHLKRKNHIVDRQAKKVNKAKQIVAADIRSHDALNANCLENKLRKHEKCGFFVPGTPEFVGLVFGLMININECSVDGQVKQMNCKSLGAKRDKSVAASMCNQSVKKALKKCKQPVTQNVTTYHLVNGSAILVALIKETNDTYTLQSIYGPLNAFTLALAGALQGLLKDSECEDTEFDGNFDFVENPVLPTLDGNTLDNVVYLLANKNYLRQQITLAKTGNIEDDVIKTDAGTYDSGMPFFIHQEHFDLFEYLKTEKGKAKLTKWIERYPTSMSINEYREWLFKPDGENMLNLFWKVIDESDDVYFDDSIVNDSVMNNSVVNDSVVNNSVVNALPVNALPEVSSKKTYNVGGAAFLEGSRESMESPTTTATYFEEIPDDMKFLSTWKEDHKRSKDVKVKKSSKSKSNKGSNKRAISLSTY